MMAGRLGQSNSSTTGLFEYSWYTVVRTQTGLRNDNRCTGNRVMGSQVLLMQKASLLIQQ